MARFHIRSWVGVRDADVLGVVGRGDPTAEEAAALLPMMQADRRGREELLRGIAQDVRASLAHVGEVAGVVGLGCVVRGVVGRWFFIRRWHRVL